MSNRTGFGLALGGGFARGFAHLGVLQVFEQNHIPISHIAGTSVGIVETCRTLRVRDIACWRVSRLGAEDKGHLWLGEALR